MTGSKSLLGNVGRVALPIAVIGGGVAVFAALRFTKPTAKRTAPDDRGVLVEAVTARVADHPIEVLAQGRVIPARTIVVSSEVGGRIVWQNPELVLGGRIGKGAALVRIDARDYELALQQQEAAVDRAQLELEVERGRKKVAEREWELLGGDASGGQLALREPQLRTATVAVEAARSGRERAKLAVDRTVVRAPFAAMVQAEAAEVGQLVGPHTPLATLIGTDAFWVQVSVPVDNLARLAIPGVNARDGEGSAARVTHSVGGEIVAREGRIVRLLGELDPTGGMARLLVEIADPLGAPGGEGGWPMLVGAFVDVRIAGGEIRDAIELPRTALREGSRVWVIANDDTLAVRDVAIVWRREDSVLVQSGVAAGDRVITSRIADPVPGMIVRTIVPDAGPDPAEKASL